MREPFGIRNIATSKQIATADQISIIIVRPIEQEQTQKAPISRTTDMDTLKLFSMLLICAALMFVCDAQLTFTPAWGKRSQGALGISPLGSSYGQDACKTPVDSLLVIYRMIQAEAQKIVDCSQK